MVTNMVKESTKHSRMGNLSLQELITFTAGKNDVFSQQKW